LASTYGGNLIGLELADEGVRALREVGLEDRVVAIGEQGGIVVSVGTVHDQDDGLGHTQDEMQLTRPLPSSVPTATLLKLS